MKDEPPLDAKCKDKFLVQTVAVTGDMEFANVTSIVSFAIPHRESTQTNKCIVRKVFQIVGSGTQDSCELAGARFGR